MKRRSWIAVFIIILLIIAFALGRLSRNIPKTKKGAGVHESSANKTSRNPGKQLYTCGMHPQVIQDHPGDCPICGMTLTPVKDTSLGNKPAVGKASGMKERKVLYWRAPMDPAYISKTPGKSPMGMDLVPVYEDEVSSGEISISPAVEQNMGITTVEAISSPLFRSIRTYGNTTWNETSLAAINTKIDGWIEKLWVNETGQLVRKGRPLLSIYSPKLVATQREYLAALDTARALQESSDPEVASGGTQLLDAARRRLKLWDISDKQIEAIEKTRTVRKTMTLYAPINGIVTHRAVVLGDHVQAGQNLVKIAALDPIWIIGSIYEADISFVKKGMESKVSFDSLPGISFTGKVDYVYPYVEGRSRTARVRIVLRNAKKKILPDMYAEVRIRVPLSREAVVVPEDAVIRASSTESVVFIARGEGKFEGRKVVLGPEGDGGMVSIKAGLEPGERVVTAAQFLLDSESNLKAAIRSMLDSREQGAPQ